MKRKVQVAYEDASPEVQRLYDEIMGVMGTDKVLNSFAALGNNPVILRGVWNLMRCTLIEGEIPALLKQLILFKISIFTGNRYCESLHGHAALNLDPTLKFGDLEALAQGTCSPSLPPSYPVAIDIVSKIALEPKSVDAPEFDFEDQLRDEGFSESEIDELLAQAYFGVMLNIFTDCYDFPWEQPFPPEGD